MDGVAVHGWGRCPWLGSLSMDGVAVHGWGLPSMDGRLIGGRKPIHETYGRVPWKVLPSMEIPPIHRWEAPIHGRQDP